MTAAISFNQIPVNLLTPGQYVEFDNSRAIGGLVNMPQRVMLIAPMIGAGVATPDIPFQVSREADGITALGRGSIGAAMTAFVAKGIFSSYNEGIRAMVHIKDEFIPDMKVHAIYEELYNEVFDKIFDKLSPLYAKIGRMQNV